MKSLLDHLKELTRNTIEQDKDLRFTVPGAFKEIDRYYEKYLKKARPTDAEKKIIEAASKRRNNNVRSSTRFNVAVTHHHNVLLAMAFSKAEKLFSELKKQYASGVQNSQIPDWAHRALDDYSSPEQTEDYDEVLFSPIEALAISYNLMRDKNGEIVKNLKKGELRALDDYQKHLGLIFRVLKELRNYHAHILHEPGPIRFENLYGDDLLRKGKLTQQEWNIAKEWFKAKWADQKQRKLESLDRQEQDIRKKLLAETSANKKNNSEDALDKALKDIQSVRERIVNYEFERNGRLSDEALLFIVCMFLRKGDAEYFVNKWTNLKRAEGAFRTAQKFFTDYAVRNRKSLQQHNIYLLKFRKAISQLGTMPHFENNVFAPINDYIQKHNAKIGRYIDAPRLPREASFKNKKVAELQRYTVPFRKSFSPIKWYLDFLCEKGLLNEFAIACYKTPEERLTYLKMQLQDENVTEWKQRMKRSMGDDKRRLTAIYKEAKKNFVFKTPDSVNNDYCIKNDTTMLQYSYDGVTIQANLSCDLLMKWVFAEVVYGKGVEVKKDIEGYLKNLYHNLSGKKYKQVNSNRLPPSIRFVDAPIPPVGVKEVRNTLQERLNALQGFLAENNSKKVPWRFAAKRKIDIIFQYVHLSYTKKALEAGKDVSTRRHEALNDPEYLDALECFRFYRKNKYLPEYRNLLEGKAVYFAAINDCLHKANTLEELFDAVSYKLVRFYDKGLKQLTGENFEKYAVLLKLKKAEGREDIDKLTRRFSVNQIIPHQLIDLMKMAKDDASFQNWKKSSEKRNRKFDKSFLTDFSLMRYILSHRNRIGTNSDYLLQVIMQSGIEIKKNEKGKVEGNQTLYKTLMKNKTDELMVWEVAKEFWKMGTGNVYPGISGNWTFAYDYSLIDHGTKDFLSEKPYKDSMYFYRVFEGEVNIPIRGSKVDDQPIQLRISPKKFDDEFLFYESKELYYFIKEWERSGSSDEVWQFENVHRKLKDTIAGYLDDLYLLLVTECHVVQNNYEVLTQLLCEKSETPQWDGYHVIFGRRKSYSDRNSHKSEEKSKFENALVSLIHKEIDPGNKCRVEQLIEYRNNVLHQQIQRSKRTYETIRKLLTDYCVQNRLFIQTPEKEKARTSPNRKR